MTLYAVYPRPDHLDLSGNVHAMAIFVIREHAEEYRKRWGEFAEIVELGPRDALAALLDRRVA